MIVCVDSCTDTGSGRADIGLGVGAVAAAVVVGCRRGEASSECGGSEYIKGGDGMFFRSLPMMLSSSEMMEIWSSSGTGFSSGSNNGTNSSGRSRKLCTVGSSFKWSSLMFSNAVLYDENVRGLLIAPRSIRCECMCIAGAVRCG